MDAKTPNQRRQRKYREKLQELLTLKLASEGVRFPYIGTTKGGYYCGQFSGDLEELLSAIDPFVVLLDATASLDTSDLGAQLVLDNLPFAGILISSILEDEVRSTGTGNQLTLAEVASQFRSVLSGCDPGGEDLTRQQMEDEFVVELGRANQDRIHALGNVSLISIQLDRIRAELDGAVAEARSAGATWAEIGVAGGVTAPTALRRWDRSARERHSAYQRDRYRTQADQ